MTRLADTRKTATIQEAEEQMSNIRRLTCERDVIIARAEKRIAKISNDAQMASAPIDEELVNCCKRLSDFILQNKHLFKTKRAHKTADGKFGLRKATKLIVSDNDTLLQFIMENGYDDCVKVTRSLNKPAITKRIKAKCNLPGTILQTGDIAFCEVNKALVKEAVEHGTAK